MPITTDIFFPSLVPPSPPTAPLEVRPTGPNSLMIEWGAPESDGGAPLLGYIIAIRDIKRTMWIEVGQVGANFTRLHIKELQVGLKKATVILKKVSSIRWASKVSSLIIHDPWHLNYLLLFLETLYISLHFKGLGRLFIEMVFHF